MSSIAGLPVDNTNISNLKDILLTYNRITEACFSKCVYTFNYRTVTPDEEACINNCSGKFINGNQRIMQTFMEVQSQRQQAMVQEMETKALEEQQQQQLLAQQTTTTPPNTSQAVLGLRPSNIDGQKPDKT